MLIRCLDNIDHGIYTIYITLSTQLYYLHLYILYIIYTIRFFTQKSPEYFRATWPQLEAIMRSGPAVEEENGEVNLSEHGYII